jgi:hypothetical protein
MLNRAGERDGHLAAFDRVFQIASPCLRIPLCVRTLVRLLNANRRLSSNSIPSQTARVVARAYITMQSSIKDRTALDRGGHYIEGVHEWPVLGVHRGDDPSRRRLPAAGGAGAHHQSALTSTARRARRPSSVGLPDAPDRVMPPVTPHARQPAGAPVFGGNAGPLPSSPVAEPGTPKYEARSSPPGGARRRHGGRGACSTGSSPASTPRWCEARGSSVGSRARSTRQRRWRPAASATRSLGAREVAGASATRSGATT